MHLRPIDLFEARVYGNWSILAKSGIPPEECIKILSSKGDVQPDAGLFTRVRSSSNARVYRATCICQGTPVEVYFKHYLFRSGFDFFKHLFRPGRGKRALNSSLMLREHGFKAPEPLILMQKKLGPFTTENILVTAAVTESMRLNGLLEKLGRTFNQEAFKKKKRIIIELGKLVGKMHALGIIHGDLRLSNVLIQNQGEIPCFFFIDNESTRKYERAPYRLIKKNLVQINMQRLGVNNADRMRFMKVYAQYAGLKEGETRKIIKDVLDRTVWRLKKKTEKKSTRSK